MENNENKKIYRYLNLSMIFIYCMIYIRIIFVDVGFTKFFENENNYSLTTLMFSTILFFIFILLPVGLFLLVSLVFRKLKFLIPHIIFASLIDLYMIYMVLDGGGAEVGSIIFPWYFLFEFVIIFLTFILFLIILIIALIVKFIRYLYL